jgi:hypothetical protein
MATQDKNAIDREDLTLSKEFDLPPLSTHTTFETLDGVSYDVEATKWIYDTYKKARVNIGAFEDSNTGKAKLLKFIGGKMLIQAHEVEEYRFMKFHPACEGSPFASENKGKVVWREIDVRLQNLYDARKDEIGFVADSTLRNITTPELKQYLRSYAVNPENNTSIHALQQKAKEFIKDNAISFIDEYAQDERSKLLARIVLAHQINVLKFYQGQWSIDAQIIVVCPEFEYADQVLIDFLTKEVLTDNEKVLVQKVFDKIGYNNHNPKAVALVDYLLQEATDDPKAVKAVAEKAPELPQEKPKK